MAKSLWTRSVVVGIALAGLVILTTGCMLQQAWFDWHFLPNFSMSSAGRNVREIFARAGLILLGAALVWLALQINRSGARILVKRVGAPAARVAGAAFLALAVCEVLLRTVYSDLFNEIYPDRRPTHLYDARLGWVHVPGRTERVTVAGRSVDYAMDAHGNRVNDIGLAERTDLPTILVAGESIGFGYKVPWAELIAAQIAALSGVHTENIAVEGYSSSQAYLRLTSELPRFGQPIAVVTIFLPSVFRKNLDRSRPGVDSALQWRRPDHPLRLQILGRWLLPYTSSAELENGIRTARAIVSATANLAQARGAIALTVIPQLLPETPGEEMIRRRVFDDAGLPYVLVGIDPNWHVPDDRHTDIRGNRAIAEAIVRALKLKGVEVIAQ